MQQMLGDRKRHRYIRRRAIYILCRLEAKESLDTMKSLVQDPDTQLRCKMADALTYFKNNQDAISILQHLRNDPIEEVRKRAQATLDEMIDK
jgi:HEAT repeat protein